ncbi:MAG: hypothetical protein HYZ85_00370 [Candidatus Omnitrophica bacterium]|nr:hypothetical protein [Candidatus Omnitrophota bacterium]
MTEYKKIISEIDNFKKNVSLYFQHRFDHYSSVSEEQLKTIREAITRQSTKMKKYLSNANVPTRMSGRAAPVAGGFLFSMDLIDDMFHNEGGPYAVPPDSILDALNKAIGIYESGDLPEQPHGQLKGPSHDSFINYDRMQQLKALRHSDFDLSRLLQILKEINLAFQNESYISVIQLTRAVIDHVPPIFGQKTFAQVASNYGGSKSFRESMQHLENSSRKIADQHLHCQIRKKEVLPNRTQVNFSHDVDVFLAEIVRILK